MLYFLHIPKTAGISLKSILSEYFPVGEVLDFQFQPEILTVPPLELRKYRLVLGHCTFGLMEYIGAPYEVVTFLREPVQQAISMFFDMKANGVLPAEAALSDVLGSNDVERLINLQCRWLCSDDLSGANLGYTPYYTSRSEAVHALTQESLFERAAERLRRLRFVGITERFGNSVDLLCDEFGWPRTTRAVRLNGRSEKDGRYLDERSVRQLGELLEPDRKLYELGVRLLERQQERSLRGQANAYHRRLCAMAREREVELRAEQAVRGTGWHGREAGEKCAWVRWSGPGNTATLELPLATGADMDLRFFVEAVITETGMEDLVVRVNGVEAELRHYFLKGGKYENALFTARIPREVLRRQAGYATIEFLAREVRRPCRNDPGIADERWLGIKLGWVSVTPARGAEDG